MLKYKENGSSTNQDLELMKQSLRNRFGVGNHEEQRQGQEKGKIMEFSMGEKSTKANKLSQAQDVLDRKVIHSQKKNICNFVKEENSREKKVKSVVSTKEKKIQSQFLNFLPTTCGTKPNHRMKAKEEGMGKELSIGLEDTSLSLSLNPFLLYHELPFKELKLFLELYASYVNLDRNVMVNLFTSDLAFDIDNMLKCSSHVLILRSNFWKLPWVSILSFSFQGIHVVATLWKENQR
ncbi:hypothetical protein M9H77_21504 [Catharanthus roseus]|uniref:Uncharacterized protein n=1 Tax=Catharanthus roseus TaxID=4058 RepID=A0ACC0ANI9_CATRO|nr:hypothetical protein M9H77_21504 [Catharanthus roseus]